ncbi:2,3-bisphosphoglycerate-independent phosphoglycerate mutase [Marinihelvus fidelis]|uniref:2,3-bisphosphoglycerate-independent phosphoglycerate mutase n=1 Tax=Marinihelvus fidelis TaxID=2613842 RepID=A0A5N0TA65_9GAMM|nr:2,3-bisphosphoglycerate-independent phosphoglycerate mutase [Marinihelvus fidelis]KAA9131852.1 2,3-bisphosphoglycerate-independent phosphoglycerate mutase [Marinihelvus fidelis]
MSNSPLVLMILDGWGYREPGPDNAISQANTPNWDTLWDTAAHTLIDTSGESVGLPAGQMGNSEVGHMNIGAGRVVYQDFTRITQAVKSGEITENAVLVDAIEAAQATGHTVHIMGLLSPGGVHSHEEHFRAVVEMAASKGAGRIRVHAFLDGRDTPPRSAQPSLAAMQSTLDGIEGAAYATVTGRYYAMDRDQRWDRVERAWKAIVEADSTYSAGSAGEALGAAYGRDENDEFVAPTVIGDYAGIADGDAVIFVNFRADRARQISRAFREPGFDGFERRVPDLSAYVCMTEYIAGLPASIAFPPESLSDLLGEVLSREGLRQLRAAETEKYAHVTFFLNGGREEPFAGEQRILIPSPRVATYDLQPEMSAPELAEALDTSIRSGDFDVIICNVANPDMVGHSGKMDAAMAAVEAVDAVIGRVCAALDATGGELLLTADHGNVEQMSDPHSGQSHTAHTTNPVPLVYRGRAARLEDNGSLRDIAPTMLHLLKLTQPAAMTGRNLVHLDDGQNGNG